MNLDVAARRQTAALFWRISRWRRRYGGTVHGRAKGAIAFNASPRLKSRALDQPMRQKRRHASATYITRMPSITPLRPVIFQSLFENAGLSDFSNRLSDNAPPTPNRPLPSVGTDAETAPPHETAPSAALLDWATICSPDHLQPLSADVRGS